MTYQVKNISIPINRSLDEVYQFTSNPENLPLWASGFVSSIVKQKDSWIGKTNFGDVIIHFTPKNKYGILDHQVTIPGDTTMNNPMRVIENYKGCEVIFTLFWLPDRTEEQFNEDVKLVTNDLLKLKELLEHTGF